MPRKGHSESFEPADNKCLIRASDGKKKISTVVGGACVEVINWLFGLLMPKFHLCLFQVSTKEVIKFQMVSLFFLYIQVTVVLFVTRDLNNEHLVPGVLQPAQSSHGRTEEKRQEEQKQENQSHPMSNRLLNETAARVPDRAGSV